MHREMISKIITEGTIAEMYELKELLVCLIDELKTTDYASYIESEYKLHCIVYGEHIGKELSEQGVSKMINKDGTKGQHWSVEQTDQVLKDKGYRFDKYDGYTVLNMMYSDNYNPRFDLATYVDLAHSGLDDADIGKKKLLDYYFYVVCSKH